MRRKIQILSLLLTVALLMAGLPAVRAADPTFVCRVQLTGQDGNAPGALSDLEAGQTVELELRLERTDQAGAFDVYGMEMQMLSSGLLYNGDGESFRGGADSVSRNDYSAGMLLGVAYYDMTRQGVSLDSPVSVCRWSYTVEDPAAAALRLNTAVIYTAGTSGPIYPSLRARLTLELDGGTLEGPDAGGEYTPGTPVILPEASRRGYRFMGWQAGNTVYPAGATYTVSWDTTLRAQWTLAVPADFRQDHIAYVQGYPDGNVCPMAPITRAETAAMIFRLLSEERQAQLRTWDNRFTDVPRDSWYTEAVSSMAAGGYLVGDPSGYFRPDADITRGEFVTILSRFVDPESGGMDFSDTQTHWARSYIQTAVARGWIYGYTDGTFRPNQSIARAEAIAILNRMLDRGVSAGSDLGSYRSFPDNPPGTWFYYEILEAANAHAHTGVRPNEQWQ